MPITREAYDKEMYYTDLEAQVFQFLQNNPNLAYTVPDLIQALNFETGKGFFMDLLNFISVQNALETLVKEGKIGSKIVRGQTFYSVR